MDKWLKTFLYLLLSVTLAHWLPFSAFFKNVDTLIHEFGHALVTLALSGKVTYIELYKDHSGETLSRVTELWTQIPIAMAGYITASLTAWFLFAAHARGQQRNALIALTAVAILTLALFIHNDFGRNWLIGFALLNLAFLLLIPHVITRYYFLLIAFLVLEEAVFGPVSLVFTAWTNPKEAGDATLLGSITSMSAVVWAIIFALFALWCAKQAIAAFAGGGVSRSHRRRRR